MNQATHDSSAPQNNKNSNALTTADDWVQYYSGRHLEEIHRAASKVSIIDDYLKNDNPGKIFELGCGSSPFLARSAQLGWEVGGIDFNAEALELIRTYLSCNNYSYQNLLYGDIFSYDNSSLTNQYDLLASFGFLEHFTQPELILAKWKTILKPGGMVISVIPNLLSFNAAIFKRYDPDFWAQHIIYSPVDMDLFHLRAGFIPVRNARYYGNYDCHMLIPWEKLADKIGNKFIYKIIKYFAYFGVAKLLGLLPKANLKKINSFVIGIYIRPSDTRSTVDSI